MTIFLRQRDYWCLAGLFSLLGQFFLCGSKYSPEKWDIIGPHRSSLHMNAATGCVLCLGFLVYLFNLLCRKNKLIQGSATAIIISFTAAAIYFCVDVSFFIFITFSALGGYFTYGAMTLPRDFELFRPFVFVASVVVMAIYLQKKWSCCILIVLFGAQVVDRILPFLERKSKKEVKKSKKQSKSEKKVKESKKQS